MKILIGGVFLAAGCSAVLSHTHHLLSPTSLVPPALFAAALVLVLLHLINVSDRRY